MSEAPAPEVVGRYAIYGKIASGGMASVHFGRLLGGAGFSRTVAIKRLHPHLAEEPEFISTMIDEARLAARIHHPNVVPTLDVVAGEGDLLLVMEYVRGESVARLLRIEAQRGRGIPLPITSAIIVGALHGLHAAHEATSDQGDALGIVHRDISPQNILVGVDGMPRVIDFGVAKAAGRLQSTREGTIKGKIAYMAPEQLASREVTRAADIYAMGVVLWEMLVGKRLFHADSDAALVKKVMDGVSQPPSALVGGLPRELDAIVLQSLARNPVHRFTSAREMADLITRVIPPALPTDVGAWCAETAREILAKSNQLLAEIESASGMNAYVPTSSTPDLASAGAPPPRGSTPRLSGPLTDDVSTRSSQVSSLSIASAAPAPSTRWRGAVALVAGALTLLAMGFAAATWSAKEPPVSPVVASAPPPPAAPLPSAAVPPPAPARPSVAVIAPPAAPLPAPSSFPSVAPLRRESPPRRPPPSSAASPAARGDCSPPFYFDGAGNKHFKPECY